MVKKLNAYTFQKLPGTIRAQNDDSELVKPVTVLVVYAEAKTADIVWDSAWFNSGVYKLESRLFSNGSFEVGFEKETGKMILLKADSGLYLYQIHLQPVEGNHPISPKYEEGKILLKGKYYGKDFYRTIGPPAEISTYDAQ